MSTQELPAQSEHIVGTIQSVETHRSGNKWIVTVMPDGSQYKKNLWTSDQGVASQLYQMIGQRLGFECNRSQPYPNAQGQLVSSLWINVAGAAAPQQQAQPMPQMPVQQTPQQQPVPMQQPMMPAMPQPVQAQMPVQMPVATMQQQGVSQDVREIRIMRQTATKVASMLISHVPAEARTLDNVITLSERLVAYYEHGVNQQATEYENTPPPPTDDDIPF